MNVKTILLSVLAWGALTAQAQNTPVWCDPNVNEINRKMDVAHYFAYESEALAQQSQSPKANAISLRLSWSKIQRQRRSQPLMLTRVIWKMVVSLTEKCLFELPD